MKKNIPYVPFLSYSLNQHTAFPEKKHGKLKTLFQNTKLLAESEAP